MSGWAAAGQVAGQLIGSYLQADATKDAARLQSDATRGAIEEQRREYEQTRRDTAPWRDSGRLAINELMRRLGIGAPPKTVEDIAAELRASGKYAKTVPGMPITWGDEVITSGDRTVQDEQAIAAEAQRLYSAQPPSAAASGGDLNKKFTLADFWSDPVTEASFKYGLDLGTKAINQNAAAGGMKRSGQTLKALTQFGTDYTGSKAGDSYNRFYADQDRAFNRLSGIAGTGQTATVNTAALGQNAATNIGNLSTAGANARGAAGIAGANAWANGINNISNWYQQQQLISAINNRNSTGYNPNATYGGQNLAQDDYSAGFY